MRLSLRLAISFCAVFGIAIVGMLATSSATLASSHCQLKGDPVRIPDMGSYSGLGAQYGEDFWAGIQVAQKIVNEQYCGIKGRPLEFYKADAPYEDLPANVTMFKKLARDPGNIMIFDANTFSVVNAIQDLTTQFGITLYTHTSGGRWKGEFPKWIFRSYFLDHTSMPVLVPLVAKKFNAKKGALVFSVDDEGMVARADAMRKAAQAIGLEIVEVSAKGNEPDFSAQVTRMASANIDVIFAAQQPHDMGLMVYQARGAGLNQPIISGPGASATDYKKMGRDRIDNTYFVGMFDPSDQRPYVQTLLTEYKKFHGKDIGTFSALTADAVLVLSRILDKAPSLTREGVRQAFANTKSIEALTGNIGWPDGKGEAARSRVAVFQWNDGKMSPVPDSFWN
jgi:branched-chain amino acid transport system substrate-binding protein